NGQLQGYNFVVKSRPGIKILNVDGLSRAPIFDPGDNLFEARIKVWKNIHRAQLYQKWHHDQQHPLQTYQVGEKVLKYNAKLAAKIGEKLEEK
ncbi:19116_t:CDS:2, partial [Gigaspora rosea]